MKLLLAVAALATLFLCPRPAVACSCLGRTGVCAAYVEAEAVGSKEISFLLSCTRDGGRFKIDQIGPGDYYLVANDDGVISSDEPFPSTYYPGVFEKEKATVLSIARGDKLQDFDLHVPAQRATRTIQGRLLFSDGRPVDDGTVEFHSEEKPGQTQQIDKLVKAYKDLETKRLTLELTRDHGNIELVFPFPFCPKAKEKRE